VVIIVNKQYLPFNPAQFNQRNGVRRLAQFYENAALPNIHISLLFANERPLSSLGAANTTRNLTE